MRLAKWPLRALSQSPYGAKPRATRFAEILGVPVLPSSQSPYGAKPRATYHEHYTRCDVCDCRNPLTGLNLVQPKGHGGLPWWVVLKSQSPYGAKPRATPALSLPGRCSATRRNPLTGLNLVQRVPPLYIVLERAPEGGICEKHEAWNMRGVNNGGF